MATVSDITTIQRSGDQFVDALLNDGPSWNYLTPGNGNILYYTFVNDGKHDASVSSLSVFNANQMTAARSALSYVESITGIDFVETSNAASAQFSFMNGNLLSGSNITGTSFNAWSWGFNSATNVLTSFTANTEIVLDIVDFPENTNPVAGNSPYETLLHEIGHSLGLKHPFEGDVRLPSNFDNTNYTIMAYNDAGPIKSTFQEFDLNALWWIYGGDGLGGQFGINSVNGPSLKETTPPTITTFSPSDEATGVAVNSNIVVTFSEAITRGNGNIVLKTVAGATIATYDAATSSNLTISGSTLTLNPTSDLTASTAYKVELAAGSIKDLAGNAFAGTTSYNFTTSAPTDTTAPLVTTFSPTDEATNVAVNSNIVLNFNEAITRGTGNIVLKTSSGATIATYDAATSSNLTVSGSTLTLNPTSDLTASTAYTVEFAAGSLKDLAGNDFAGTTSYNFTTSAPTDTTAPLVTTFSPTDEATNVAVASNIVVTFNEAIQRGTGNIVLKTSSGATIATYDAATSSNLTLSGSTLTLNPTSDLTASTAYKVEFAAGSVKDLAGNTFGGTTSYNFTTASSSVTPTPTLTKDAQFVVLQPSSPSIVGAGIGDDTYLLSGSMLSPGKSITISDAIGTNSIQLAPGLSIASSQVTSTALKLNLSNGGAVTVLGANAFTYETGGNTTAGLDDPDTSYQNFVTGTLGSSIPSSGVATTGSVVIDNISPASLLASTSSGNDFITLQYASPSIVGAGTGNDTYLLSSGLLLTGTSLTISDASGSNSIQLAPGLSIASSQVTSTALKLTLTSGATVTVLGANNFTYDVGGNTTAGIDQADVSYASLVQTTLGTTIPTSGVASGGAVVIGGSGSTGTPVQGNATVNATAANDVFYFDAVAALLDAAGTNTQASISGFSTSADRLQINLPTANAGITTLSQLNGQQGVIVQGNTIDNRTLINFGSDANGGEAAVLTLIGVTDPALVAVQVV